MNTNPSATTILCYGDSNTYGTKPDRSGRFATDVRWTGLLQQQLGNDYYVIEEGLGGRTTDLEHYNPSKPSRNGLTYFKAAYQSHSPLDIVIIMLGTNDLKTVYDRSAAEVANALGQYIDHIDAAGNWPQIIIASPALIDSNASAFISSMPEPGIYDETSVDKSKQLAAELKQLADNKQCLFIDAATLTKPGDDGLHIDEASHRQLADALAAMIQQST